MRYLTAFGRFWFDFLIGDRPELFVGPIIALALVAVTVQLGWAAASGLLLFALVVASGGWGLARDLAAVRPDRPMTHAVPSDARIPARGGIRSVPSPSPAPRSCRGAR